MKVLHVIPSLSFKCGGPVKAIYGMAEAQARAGLKVRLLATDFWQEEQVNIPGCEIRVFPCLFDRWRWSPGLGKALPEAVRWADVVNLHTLWSYPIAAASHACRAAGVPYVLRPCGMLDSWSLSQKRWKKRLYASLTERRTINGAASLWFTSAEERATARAFNYCCPETVIPLGLPRDTYERLPEKGYFRQRYPELAGRRVILFLGRITPKKKLDTLLRVFARISAEFADAVLVIVGPDEDGHLDAMQRLAQNFGIRERVYFAGGLQGRDVQAALVDTEVFVLPSLHENFGVAVLEAMACGVPVVVSDKVALATFVEESRSGLVAPPDELAITSSLRVLLNDPAFSKRLGENGRQLVMERFVWDQIVPIINTLYLKILASSNRTESLFGEARLPANGPVE
jgi:glycosyltransferase involved in cell wall biosynthesis